MPDRNVEYLFYQALFGAWPPDLAPDDVAAVDALAERIAAYMVKAARERKLETSWSNPNPDYEAALERYVRGALDASRPNPFLAEFHAFVAGLARDGAITSLAQLVLKLSVPGVPDIYQGGELWDFSLVDPDNRRPVDWAARRALLAKIGEARAGDLARGLAGRTRKAVCDPSPLGAAPAPSRRSLPRATTSSVEATGDQERPFVRLRAQP